MFTGVCLSTGGCLVPGVPARGGGGFLLQGRGTHPSGMHSCFAVVCSGDRCEALLQKPKILDF